MELYASLVHHDYLVIVGDLNLDVSSACASAREFLSFLSDLGLCQQVASPTHVSGHILDHVITRENSPATCVSVRDRISDHSAVYFSYAKCNPPSLLQPSVKRRQFKSMDIDACTRAMYSDVTSPMLWAFSFSSFSFTPDDLTNFFDYSVNRVLDVHAPLRSIRTRCMPQPPWFTFELVQS